MPNTLAHLGIQAIVTRSVIRDADEKWIYIGAVLPDVGWILQRVAQRAAVLDPYDVRLYAIAQTSLFVTLLLAVGVSLFARRWRLTLAILAMNVVIHLLLDACEIKWGNGVALFAPLSWELVNWGQFWPEQWPTQLLTLVGLAYVLVTLRRAVRIPLDVYWPGTPRFLIGACLISAYMILPWMLRDGPLAANVHYVQNLRDPKLRTRSYIEFDRERFDPGENGGTLDFFAPPPVGIVGIDLPRPATVSLRGQFIDANTIEVFQYHEHRGPSRDMPTLVGLSLVLAMVAAAWLRGRIGDGRW